jgi:hypothetical protein
MAEETNKTEIPLGDEIFNSTQNNTELEGGQNAGT